MFWGMDKWILKFIWKIKGTRIPKRILKKNKVQGITLFDFNTINYCNQGSMISAKEKTHRSMEQNREN